VRRGERHPRNTEWKMHTHFAWWFTESAGRRSSGFGRAEYECVAEYRALLELVLVFILGEPSWVRLVTIPSPCYNLGDQRLTLGHRVVIAAADCRQDQYGHRPGCWAMSCPGRRKVGEAPLAVHLRSTAWIRSG
jgi:hypothetical protein